MQAELSLYPLQQRLFADPRRIELLKQVQQTGSISQGAKLAGISYKSAWDAINEMNPWRTARWWTVLPAAKAAAVPRHPLRRAADPAVCADGTDPAEGV